VISEHGLGEWDGNLAAVGQEEGSKGREYREADCLFASACCGYIGVGVHVLAIGDCGATTRFAAVCNLGLLDGGHRGWCIIARLILAAKCVTHGLFFLFTRGNLDVSASGWKGEESKDSERDREINNERKRCEKILAQVKRKVTRQSRGVGEKETKTGVRRESAGLKWGRWW